MYSDLELGKEENQVLFRLAVPEDAKELCRLNEAFNGPGQNAPEQAAQSLRTNPREIVVVAQDDTRLAGFVCIQLKQSFCYADFQPEITELFVMEEYRRRGVASGLLDFAEEYCRANYPLHGFELLVGLTNTGAQSVYAAAGYRATDTIRMKKSISL